MTRALLARTIIGFLLLAGAWAALDVAGHPGTARPDAAVQGAVTALTTEPADVADAALPADFARQEGYRPVVRDGLLQDPRGGCSSPVPLPAEFTAACRRHDLGYDLLRVAARDGGALSATARRSIDDQLDASLHAACDRRGGLRRASCDAWATVAGAAVRVNSVRQHWSVPGHETPLSVATASAAVGALLAAALAVVVALRLVAASLVGSVRRARVTTGREVLS